MENIEIRRACCNHNDAWLIARCVMMGVGYDLDCLTTDKQQDLNELERLAMLDDTLYSYRNAFIAETTSAPTADTKQHSDVDLTNKRSIAAMVAYEGSRYRQMRAVTFPKLSFFRDQDVESLPVETCAGEFYFDTLAVLPPYRGRGIARQLFTHVIRQKSPDLIGTLLVDPDNPNAISLYQSLGFRHNGEIFAFGMNYNRMELDCPNASMP